MSHREKDMALRALVCGNCGTVNVVATCPRCSRSFVVTASHLSGEVRRFDDLPLTHVPDDYSPRACDFCVERERGSIGGAVESGLRQRTCASCHTEFLSAHGL